MDSAYPPRSFSLGLDVEGKKKLTDVVKLKLAALMESYADDVLAEYVVVLVSHGKQQAQASADLEAFLGDQSEAFVSWLWDHLAVNQDLYTHPQLPATTAAEEGTAGVDDLPEDARDVPMKDLEQLPANGVCVDPVVVAKGSPKELPTKTKNDHSKHRLVKLKKDLEDDVPDFDQPKEEHGASNEPDLQAAKEARHSRSRRGDMKRAHSPEPWSRMRRSRVDGISQRKNDASPPRVKAPTRLLESALRDAVAPSGPFAPHGGLRRMDSDRRLRSAVLADAGEANGRQRSVRPVLDISRGGSKISPAIAVALKAAAAAAEDVNNSRHSRGGRPTTSVWDRLGGKQGDAPLTRESAMEEVVREGDLEEGMDHDMTNQQEIVVENVRVGSRHGHHRSRVGKDSRRIDRERKTVRQDSNFAELTEAPSGNGVIKGQAPSQNFRGANAGGVRFEEKLEPEEASRPNVDDEGAGKFEFFDDMYENSQEEDNDETIITLHRPVEDEEVWQWNGMDCLSSVNPQAWQVYSELPASNDHYGAILSSQYDSQLLRKDLAQGSMSARGPIMDVALDKANGTTSLVDTKDVLEVKKRMRQVELEMTKLRARQAEVSKEVQKAAPAPGAGVPPAPLQRSQEDINLHSVFVTNIHFATTQEILSNHFKQCGEIVQVKMMSDNAGKPTGSAYLEFASKDGVEKALALSDSSLQSRPLKVVRKEASNMEVPAGTRPIARPPLLMPIRGGMSRGSFMRGSSMHMRRPVGRSFSGTPHLQWKRENSVAGETNQPSPVAGAIPSRGRAPAPLAVRAGPGRYRNPRSLSYVRTVQKSQVSVPVHEGNGG